MTVQIGVLALQGDVDLHLQALREVGAEGRPVRRPEHLTGLQGLILPGGESTVIGDLMRWSGLLDAVRESGLPIWGTCAGAILLATHIQNGPTYTEQPRLGLMPMTVQRNGWGRQRESFEVPLPIPALGGDPFPAVFIRAPYIERVEPGVEVLAEHQGRIVAARCGKYLATAFHPEASADRRLHRLFLEVCVGAPARP